MSLLLAGLLGVAAIAAVAWASVSTYRLLYPLPLVPLPVSSEPASTLHSMPATDGEPWVVRVLAPTGAPRGRVLVVHGYFASYHQVLGIADGLRRRGYEALLLELRGHGDRLGPCTLGVQESEDAVAAMTWAAAQAPLPLGVLALSMGAVVACQVALRMPGVQAVVLDSPYARLRPVLAQAIWQRYRLPWPAAWLTWAGLHVALRRRLGRFDPVVAARQARQPLLLIQGGDDRRVPPRLGNELYDAWAGPKDRWHESAVAHVGMFRGQPDAYAERVGAFFDRHLRATA